MANFDEFCIPLRRYEENQFLLQTNHSIRFLRGKKSNNIDIVLALESKQTLTHRCRKIGYSGNWCFFFKSISPLMLLFHGSPNFQTHLSPSDARGTTILQLPLAQTFQELGLLLQIQLQVTWRQWRPTSKLSKLTPECKYVLVLVVSIIHCLFYLCKADSESIV